MAISPDGSDLRPRRQYDALTYLDEVHAVGIYGPRGGGVSEREGLAHRIDHHRRHARQSLGCHGGYITGDFKVLDYIRSVAAGLHFHHLSAAPHGRRRFGRDPHLKADNAAPRAAVQPRRDAEGQIHAAGLPVMPSESHIVPVMIGNAAKATEVSMRLIREFGMYATPINYPTVPRAPSGCASPPGRSIPMR